MKAVICPRYGPPEVLQLHEMDKPQPKHREVLIKNHASAVTTSDLYMRSATDLLPFVTRAAMRLAVGFSGPRKGVIGLVLAGEVEAAGRSVTRFQRGERVYAFTKLDFGAYAQYTCLKESATLARAPRNLDDEGAAAILYGGMLALHCLRKGKLSEAERVLVYGASGAVGTAAVQLASHAGADVTGVSGPTNLELVRSLGAERTMDYTTEHALEPGMRFDLVLDAVGKHKTSKLKDAVRRALTPGGHYVSVDDGTPPMPARDLEDLTELAEADAIRPVIDRVYRLEDIVEAHRYVERGHKRGNVLITVGHEDPGRRGDGEWEGFGT